MNASLGSKTQSAPPTVPPVFRPVSAPTIRSALSSPLATSRRVKEPPTSRVSRFPFSSPRQQLHTDVIATEEEKKDTENRLRFLERAAERTERKLRMEERRAEHILRIRRDKERYGSKMEAARDKMIGDAMEARKRTQERRNTFSEIKRQLEEQRLAQTRMNMEAERALQEEARRARETEWKRRRDLRNKVLRDRYTVGGGELRGWPALCCCPGPSRAPRPPTHPHTHPPTSRVASHSTCIRHSRRSNGRWTSESG